MSHMKIDTEIASRTTIPKLVAATRLMNPGTPVSAYGIRKAIRDGDIQAPKIGNKYVIDPDQVLAYYSKAGTGQARKQLDHIAGTLDKPTDGYIPGRSGGVS